MPEMILPGTYIEVRAEKLIVPGPIAIGNIGIVGTAKRGRLADANDPTTVYTPTNIGAARDIFGEADAFENPDEMVPLTLIRALELAYANGAQRVFAVRVADSSATQARYLLGPVTFVSIAAGSGYNDFTIEIKAAASGAAKLDVSISKGAVAESWRDVETDADLFNKTISGTHPTYPYGTKSSTGGKSNLFTIDGTVGTVAPMSVTAAVTPGTSGAGAGPADYKAGLDALANENVHIIVLAGQSADTSAADLKDHVLNASSDLFRRERIGVIGSSTSASRTDLLTGSANAGQDEGRIIFVGPGIRTTDTASNREVLLPGSYAAAAVAGLISALDPHISPTNKVINANKLQTNFNGTDLEQLVLERILALEVKQGAIRIVRGITTSSNTAWAQVTTRRIVDYARFGVRAAANPFIGKLNNARVREALHGSINSIMADMVDREMLISYDLAVTATREQEIRGIAQVTMVVRPTFSIDYIRVVMYLE